VAELSHLPLVLQDVWSWQYEGACRQADPRLFFHPEGARGPSKTKREAQALAFCAVCPVMLECREQALSSREVYGVWGGLTEDDRERLRAENRQHRRSRIVEQVREAG
jgi:WhiB family redox-sensing transcriptional regulator